MTPKFEVGEVVLLRSPAMPYMDGEYTVTKVRNPGFKDRFGGAVWEDDVFTYELGFEFIFEGHGCRAFRDTSIRKKHQPGEMSFRDLMQTLKEPSHA